MSGYSNVRYASAALDVIAADSGEWGAIQVASDTGDPRWAVLLALAPSPYVAPAPTVPRSVTPAQAKIALLRAGKLDAAEAAVEAAGGEIELWWLYALSFERQNPNINAMAAALGWSQAELDALFVAAAAIPQ